LLALTGFHFGRLMECQGVEQPRWMAQIEAANAAVAGKTDISDDASQREAVVAPSLREEV